MEDMKKPSFTLYEDGDIGIYDLGIKTQEPLLETGPKKTDRITVVACVEGRLQVEINERKYLINGQDILLCRPNVILSNLMISPDFRGRIICLSQKTIMECIHMDNNVWNRVFHIEENPVIHVENGELFAIYGRLTSMRLKQEQRPYKKEIISSLIRASIYEMLAEMERYVDCSKSRTITQGDILFKRFMELISGMEVKSRSVSWYGERLCVTPKYLSTICKQVSGKTAYDWINQFVIMDIQHLLKYSEKSIKEISEYLDFPNISFFGKYVKSHLGYSPKEYRRIIRASKR